MFTTGETMGLAEWIIDDSCLIFVAAKKYEVVEAKLIHL